MQKRIGLSVGLIVMYRKFVNEKKNKMPKLIASEINFQLRAARTSRGERERERETDRQTDRQTHTHTDTHTHTHRHTPDAYFISIFFKKKQD